MWKHRDPIERVKALLAREYDYHRDSFAAVDAEAEAVAMDLRRDVLAMERPDPITMFDHVYAEPHPLIDEGRRDLRELGLTEVLP